MEADPPPGMWAATGTYASKAPTIPEIRRGSFNPAGGWNEDVQREVDQERRERRASQSEGGGRRWSLSRSASSQSVTAGGARPNLSVGKRKSLTGTPGTGVEPFPSVTEEEMNASPDVVNNTIWNTPKYDGIEQVEEREKEAEESKPGSEASDQVALPVEKRPSRKQRQFSNGYVPPPKLPWTTSFIIGAKSFWKWFLTPAGFLITIYGLNVVAWGGMLFLLLCNAAPAMCVPTCNDIQSPRRKWIEVDSQILNSLFCVTGFGLAPWRFRDLYWLGVWRLGGKKHSQTGIRRLAGIHRGWFRLPGSDCLDQTSSTSPIHPDNPAVPIPLSKIPDPPPTGVRAPPTSGWKMDFVVWMNACNTFLQIVLCYYMWHYNRYKRPSWATGTFVAMGCIAAGVGGIMMFIEGKAVKKVEGVPPKVAETVEDVEAQVAGIGKGSRQEKMDGGIGDKM